MTTQPSANNQDPTLYCAYFGGPRDGLKTGDLPASLSGKKLTGTVSKMPLSEPHKFSLYAVYECTSEGQVNGFWEFHYRGMEGPDGETLVAAAPDPVAALDPEELQTSPGTKMTSVASGEAEGAKSAVQNLSLELLHY